VLREWRASNNKKHWQKAVTILESRNLSPKNIAAKIERSENDVEKWIQAFNRFGLDGLKKPDGRRGPVKSRERERRAAIRDQKVRRILEIVHAKPSAYGINRSSWHRPSIVRAYKQVHNETISVEYTGHLLRQFGYAIRKARKVLTSPDPHYREKVDLLLSTLQNLKPRELFFFVDELGPLRVKKYGGRALVRKNEVPTYPQEQAHRGVVMMSGALSATTNQMTWVYGRAKDTAAMIDLLELLHNQYFSSPKLLLARHACSTDARVALCGRANRRRSRAFRAHAGSADLRRMLYRAGADHRICPLRRYPCFADRLGSYFALCGTYAGARFGGLEAITLSLCVGGVPWHGKGGGTPSPLASPRGCDGGTLGGPRTLFRADGRLGAPFVSSVGIDRCVASRRWGGLPGKTSGYRQCAEGQRRQHLMADFHWHLLFLI
jgi:transposase